MNKSSVGGLEVVGSSRDATPSRGPYTPQSWAAAECQSFTAVPGRTQQGPALVDAGAVGTSQQGYSVGIAGDGNTAIVGGPRDNSDAGAAWLFSRNGGNGTHQGGKPPEPPRISVPRPNVSDLSTIRSSFSAPVWAVCWLSVYEEVRWYLASASGGRSSLFGCVECA